MSDDLFDDPDADGSGVSPVQRPRPGRPSERDTDEIPVQREPAGDEPDSHGEGTSEDATPKRKPAAKKAAAPRKRASGSKAAAPPPDEGHRRRVLTTLVVLLLVIAGGIYYAASYWRDDPPRPGRFTHPTASAPATSTAPTPSCTPTPTQTIAPKDVRVAVLNSTRKPGLAARTRTSAKKLGFTVVRWANERPKRALDVPAEIRFGPDAREQAKALAAYVPGAKLVESDRKGTVVDLVLGESFTELSAKPTAAATPGC